MPERLPRLNGKVAIITGAGTIGPGVGNGKATAILFAREGAKVLLVDIVLEAAEETLKLIEEDGGVASTFQADVSKAKECENMVETCIKRFGRLDILVNNVGISSKGDALTLDESEWDQVMDVNVKSVVLTSRAAIPEMIKGGGGVITNLSSIAGLRAHSPLAYSVSKTAIIGLTQTMASDHGADNIRVNCIAPGQVYTPRIEKRMTEGLRGMRMETSPLGTEGTAWDIGWANVYLASDEARWVTGVTLPVDAGLAVTTPATQNRQRSEAIENSKLT